MAFGLQENHPKGVIIIDVYVDDLISFGPPDDVRGALKEIRGVVNMEDPTTLGKYLGCLHRIQVEGTAPKRVTTVEWDMCDYNRATVDAYSRDTGFKHGRHVDSPFSPKLDDKAYARLLEDPGKLDQRQCASHLMKALYGARMA